MVEALSDDLNTPGAITYLRQLHSERTNDERYAELIENCEALGLFTSQNVGAYTLGVSGTAKPDALNRNYDLVENIKVAVANNNTNFVTSASAQLNAQGIEIQIDSDGYVSLQMKVDAGPDQIEQLIAAREAARRAKNFNEADRIRDELAAMGVVLKDSKDGTTWEIAR
jgi:cysteinyl-tRNA synthetase